MKSAGLSRFNISPQKRGPTCFWLGLAGVLLYAAGYNWSFGDMVNLSFDETAHLMWLRLIEAGYQPYAQVYITYPPVFPLFLELSWALWPSLEGLCWASFGYGILTAVAVALIARRISTPLAGVFAALVIANSFGTCTILSEELSMSGTVFAVWLALVYRDTSRRWVLMSSAVAFALSQLTKIQSPFIPGVMALILAEGAWPEEKTWRVGWRNFRWRQFITDGLIWGGTVLLVAAAFYLPYQFQPLFAQTLGQHFAAREAYMDDASYWTSSLKRLQEFAQPNYWMLLLAAVGFGQMFVQKIKDRYVLLLWFALALMMLLIYRPLRDKHLIVFLPLLAIWTGLAVSAAWQALRHLKTTSWPARLVAIGTCFLLLSYLAPMLATLLNGWPGKSPLIAGGIPADKETEIEFIHKVTTPTDCLLTDNMRLAYFSGRQVPPELAEISSNRFRSGYLTLADLVIAGSKNDCQVVLTDSRIARFTPDFIKWAEYSYLGRYRYDDNKLLYVAKKDTTPNPEHPAQIKIGDAIRFLGYTLETDQSAGKQQPTLILFWEASAPVDTNYTIFVQLRDANNNTVATADHQPYEGIVPTAAWPVGTVIRDVVQLDLPPDLLGDYKIAIGMYELNTLKRLPVQNDTSGENAILLSPLKIGY